MCRVYMVTVLITASRKYGQQRNFADRYVHNSVIVCHDSEISTRFVSLRDVRLGTLLYGCVCSGGGEGIAHQVQKRTKTTPLRWRMLQMMMAFPAVMRLRNALPKATSKSNSHLGLSLLSTSYCNDDILRAYTIYGNPQSSCLY